MQPLGPSTSLRISAAGSDARIAPQLTGSTSLAAPAIGNERRGFQSSSQEILRAAALRISAAGLDASKTPQLTGSTSLAAGIELPCTISSKKQLLRKADATQQVSEARVGTQWIEPGLYFEITQTERVLLIRFIQPGKGHVFLTQACIDQGHVGRWDIAVF